eukprot:756048-Hanusia_phi.AAC.3
MLAPALTSPASSQPNAGVVEVAASVDQPGVQGFVDDHQQGREVWLLQVARSVRQRERGTFRQLRTT